MNRHPNRDPARRRPTRLLLLALAALLAAMPVAASAQTFYVAQAEPVAPRIEVAFVLDTTGSMNGLIEGAKAKIWDIANLIISAQPTPEVRFGLVGYRDRGDDYVTREFDLTDDIDAIYGHLMSFTAEGGGDTPEDVNRALLAAVDRMAWTTDNANGGQVLRLVFLVGDAPPQTYPGEDTYQQVVARARERGIVINTVQCGGATDTATTWQEIASLGAGEYSAIAQSGDVVVVATPFDDDLVRLNRELGGTIVAFGAASEREAFAGYQATSEEAAAPATADRLHYNRSRGVVAGAGGDLVDGVNNGTIDLDELADDALPEPMQGMNSEERAAYVAQQNQRRTELQGQIDALLAQRQSFLDADRLRRFEAGELTGFDAEVRETIRTQAEAVNIAFE